MQKQGVYFDEVCASCQSIFIIRLLGLLTRRKLVPFELNVDNKLALYLMKNLVFHVKSKYIDTRFHFISEFIKWYDVAVKLVSANEQRTDILILDQGYGQSEVWMNAKVYWNERRQTLD